MRQYIQEKASFFVTVARDCKDASSGFVFRCSVAPFQELSILNVYEILRSDLDVISKKETELCIYDQLLQ